jgi:hypothetical protein
MSPTCVPSWMCVIYWMIFLLFLYNPSHPSSQKDFYIQIGDVAKVAIIQ